MPGLRFGKLPRLRALLRSHFLSGVLVVVPLGAIVWIAFIALKAVWGLSDLLPAAWRPQSWLADPTAASLVKLAISLGCLVALVLSISLVGWISNQFFGQKILELFSDVIKRIPVLRSIHSALDQLLRTVATGSGQQFSRVVYVEYPRKGAWVLAFVTSPARGPAALRQHLNLYVPTTPNPTSGFHLIVPESDVIESHLTVEEAFRTILSLGMAQPGSDAPGSQAVGSS